MIRVYWHITRRFYEVRAYRASSKGLTGKYRHFRGKAVKYSSLIENYEAHHKNPEPGGHRLPFGWWAVPSAAAGAGLILFALVIFA
ncbi:hypothetical protein ORIO_12475 [Cereibacter azotoformans]|uniref:hypothetical protein n=1 Tax=Cereibacter azotoformans TaxID=43057 RepID=UPI001EE9E461|nr:hypothetical protein [Cereibacter azotoformans]ULB10719.1 hypothetical protein ORIO_12475 [Cereibacter azotoformans]